MKIKLPKPKITCPKCGNNIESFCIEGVSIDTTTIYSDCNKCGAATDIDVKFEEDHLFCNCEFCKKING